MDTKRFLTLSEKILFAYNKSCAKLLHEFDISQTSFDILMFLHNNPEYVTAQDICEIRHIKKGLVSVHVEKLVKAGLLKRSGIENDRRKIALSCSEKAMPIIEAGLKLQQDFFNSLGEGISDENLLILKQIHERIEENAILIANGKL